MTSTPPDRPAAEVGRRYLFVTMPAGPFSRRLQRALAEAGASARRVVMNGGDLWDWGRSDAERFDGPPETFRPWIEGVLGEGGYTDVVVFNDVNPYSQEALDAARGAGLGTWILENGYQRPDWITLERIGVNARSGLPRDPRAYDDADALAPPQDGPHLGTITPFHVVNTIWYFTCMVALSPWMRGYRYPYTVTILGQIVGHTRRYAVWLWRRHARERQAERVARLTPFMLIVLQREGDSQLMVHSDLKTNRAYLTTVLDSFAAHAPHDLRLVVKNHPLDPGIEDLERLTRGLAAERGIGHRVSFLEGGAFASLARAARGVVSVNSTAALAAIGFGTPVKLMGRAFFDMPGLVDQQPLDAFWTAPAAPDADLFRRFRRRMSVETQVYGSYHNPENLDGTAARIAARLLAQG